ncbi:MAG: TonB-dependent receptor, partial [Gemmatimonadales bacterium]
RRSYLDLLFKAAGFSFVPSYWDFTLKTTHPLGSANRLEFLAIGALDKVTFFNETEDDRYDNSRILSPEQNQYFAGFTWKHFFDAGLLSVTLGRTFVDFRSQQLAYLDQEQEIFRSFSKEGENSLRTNLVWEATPRLELNVGNVTKFASKLRYDVFVAGETRLDENGNPAPLEVDTSFTALRNATYLEASYYLTPTLRATLGMRGTYYDFLDAAFTADPRVGVRWDVGRQTTLTLGAGRYHQAPSYIWLIGDPSNRVTLDPIRADQVVAGLERQLRPDTKLQFEVYYKRYGRYPARVFRPQAVLAPSGFEDATTDVPFGLEPLTGDATGRSYGAELLVQKRLSEVPFYGLASLAVARSEFTSLEGVTRAGAYDGRVIANLVAGWRINRAWELSGKFRLATGLPTTPFLEAGPNTGRLDFSQYNEGPRLPTFHALDVRIDRRWSFRGWQLDVYLDVQNVYGRKNVSQLRWDFRAGVVEPNESLGVLPSIGVNVEF